MMLLLPLLLLYIFPYGAPAVVSADSKRVIVHFDGYYPWQDSVRQIDQFCNCGRCLPIEPNFPIALSDALTVEVVNCSTPAFITAGSRIRQWSDDRLVRAAPLSHARHTMSRGAPLDMFRLHRHMEAEGKQVHAVLHAHYLWNKQITGQGVRVAIFDTGLPASHAHFRHVQQRIDWTDERSADDFVGHGTFVASVIAGTYRLCPGLAPDAQLFIYKVFNKQQLSYTSWFLDAFNHAIQSEIDVLNLSIGGPDFTDQPFMDKVAELAANGIALVSAIGNDGPTFGTLNNPADQLDAIGVGAVNWNEHIAKYSSRGMSTWELPGGSGRVKPDLVTYGTQVQGSSLAGSCRQLSGTSVAAPVVTGAIALLISAARASSVDVPLNVAVVKQVLMASARHLPGPATMFEQGSGLLSLLGAYEMLMAYKPQASLHPPFIDAMDCPYFWPYCTQPLYADALPVMFNVSIVNGANVHSTLIKPPVWHQYANGSRVRDIVSMAFTWSHELWPYAGWLGLSVSVRPSAVNEHAIVTGHVQLTIDTLGQSQTLKLPVRLLVVPRPPKNRRLLWDQYRQQNYPPGYIPRDDLLDRKDPLDWHGDHPHTNYKSLYHHLRLQGYHIEVSGQPLTCVSRLADRFGALLLVDTEDEFFPAEITYLQKEVARGLNLIVFAEWFNTSVMHHIGFNDDNTRLVHLQPMRPVDVFVCSGWWEPAVGGANVPGLNRLLSHWHLALTDLIIQGNISLFGGHQVHVASAAAIQTNDSSVLVHVVDCCLFDQGAHLLAGGGKAPKLPVSTDTAVFALVPPANQSGFVSVFGDANCLTPSPAYKHADCFWLLDSLLQLVNVSEPDSTAWPAMAWLRPSSRLADPLPVVEYPSNSTFGTVSRVLLSIDTYKEVDTPQTVQFRPFPSCMRHEWQQAAVVSNYTMPDNMAASFKLLSIELPTYALQPWGTQPPDVAQQQQDDGVATDVWSGWSSLPLLLLAVVCALLLRSLLCVGPGRRRTRLRRALAAAVRRLNC